MAGRTAPPTGPAATAPCNACRWTRPRPRRPECVVNTALTAGRSVVPASQPTSRPHCQLSAVVRYGPIALCADCDARRSTLGKGITPHRLPPQPPLDVLDWIASADAAVHQAHTELAAAVARARARQHSWAVIGAVQHTSRQAVQQRFGQDLPVER